MQILYNNSAIIKKYLKSFSFITLDLSTYTDISSTYLQKLLIHMPKKVEGMLHLKNVQYVIILITNGALTTINQWQSSGWGHLQICRYMHQTKK